MPKTGKRTTCLVTILVLVLVVSRFAWAQSGEIKALVIGNDSYPQSEMFPSLKGTPHRDADAVEKALQSAGVSKSNITTLYDLDYESLENAIYNFRQKLNSEDSAIFYFSGHGFSIDERAFLVPVDFVRGAKTRKSPQSRSVSLDQVKKDLSKARMRALIIDACRTNLPSFKQASNPSVSSLENLYDTKPAGTGELIVFASQGEIPRSRIPQQEI